MILKDLYENIYCRFMLRMWSDVVCALLWWTCLSACFCHVQLNMFWCRWTEESYRTVILSLYSFNTCDCLFVSPCLSLCIHVVLNLGPTGGSQQSYKERIFRYQVTYHWLISLSFIKHLFCFCLPDDNTMICMWQKFDVYVLISWVIDICTSWDTERQL